MSNADPLLAWLRAACSEHVLEPVAVYRRSPNPTWPLHASSEDELSAKLARAGHFLPLPKEPAALANIVEVSLVDFLLDRLEDCEGAEGTRGTERGYPDIEIFGPKFGDAYHAVDIKVARRAKSARKTQSRITLYTGNTYFRYPTLHWKGTFRPFADYASHLDLIALYTLNVESVSRIEDFELIVHESWRIGSKQRSSTTREYLGAVTSIADLRAGRGNFEAEEEFYKFWRAFPFKIGRAVQKQLDKLIADQTAVPKPSAARDG